MQTYVKYFIYLTYLVNKYGARESKTYSSFCSNVIDLSLQLTICSKLTHKATYRFLTFKYVIYRNIDGFNYHKFSKPCRKSSGQLS